MNDPSQDRLGSSVKYNEQSITTLPKNNNLILKMSTGGRRGLHRDER